MKPKKNMKAIGTDSHAATESLKHREHKESLEQKTKDPRQEGKAEAKKSEEKHARTHNSLQHDTSIAVPLLSALVEALKKENADEEIEENSLETKAKDAKEIESTEKKKDKRDAAIALAERIKSLYANELREQLYSKALQTNYINNSMQYQNDTGSTMQKAVTTAYGQDNYEGENQKIKVLDDENSTGYKISKGSKYQAFVMIDPRGRWHSTWEIVRIINKANDGTIERNDGLHYQGL